MWETRTDQWVRMGFCEERGDSGMMDPQIWGIRGKILREDGAALHRQLLRLDAEALSIDEMVQSPYS